MKNLFLALSLGTLLIGCGGANHAILRGGMWPSSYQPPVGSNHFRDSNLIITIDKISNGGMATNFFAQVTVRNEGATPTVFDPGEIEITVPETGMTYEHITKDRQSVTVPIGYNLMGSTTVKPGRTITGSLWFMTPTYKAVAKTLQVDYRNHSLVFPPKVAERAKEGAAIDEP